jgi:hypothetical protein
MRFNTYLAEQAYQDALAEKTEQIFEALYHDEWLVLIDKLVDTFSWEDRQLDRLGITQTDLIICEDVMLTALQNITVDRVLSKVLQAQAQAEGMKLATEYARGEMSCL